jgi:redox-sensitive bicupin YhaK (pirin superfamily)
MATQGLALSEITERSTNQARRHPVDRSSRGDLVPAVSVADLSVLPTLPVVDPAAGLRTRPVRQRTTAPGGFEGEGFPVKRAFAGVDLAMLDPFIMMDEMGEVDYAPGEPKGTPWHPHRGFETVTYIIDGTFVHQDSYGGGGTITNGATQWMTAGSGILHIEAPPEALVASGGLFHGLQLWVNLPRPTSSRRRATRTSPPSRSGCCPRRTAVRWCGSSPARSPGTAGRGSTHTPITMIHATLAPGARLDLPWRADFNALVYVMSGRGAVGGSGAVDGASVGGAPIEGGRLAVLGAGDLVTVTADEHSAGRHTEPLEVIVLGGAPIREPIAWAGPFVMNTRAEVVQAFEDYQAGRLGRPS